MDGSHSRTAVNEVSNEKPASPRGKPASKKLSGKAVAGSLLGRFLHPAHLVRAGRLQLGRKKHRHTFDDQQLALYSRMLPSDFLHYGYFDDPATQGEDISLNDVVRAQNRYAELLLELAGDRSAPALDVGCGMGGLTHMLKCQGYRPVALTPDRLQASHVQASLPDIEVIRSKFEDLRPENHAHEYGTVFTSESLQYLKLPKALPIMAQILKPGGRWVACDFFHSTPVDDRSCHVYDDFVAQVNREGWRIVHDRNITPHILPTLRYIHMWATRFGVPLMQFAFLRLRRKQPGLHHLVGGLLDQLETLASSNIELIDPAHFAANKKYVLLAMERA